MLPGFFTSEVTDQYHDGYLDTQLSRVVLGRKGRPEEIAATVVWLASAASGYVTGQSVVVDGGLTVA